MKHTIISTKNKNNKIFVEIPKDYSPISLPSFNEWVRKLESGKIKQTSQTLCTAGKKSLSYCCLGVLSKIQNRLKKDSCGCFLDGSNKYYLSTQNPNYAVFGYAGDFPDHVKVSVHKNFADRRRENLASLNDDGFSFKDIAKVIKLIWKE